MNDNRARGSISKRLMQQLYICLFRWLLMTPSIHTVHRNVSGRTAQGRRYRSVISHLRTSFLPEIVIR